MKLVEVVKDYASLRVILKQLEALQNDAFYPMVISFFSSRDVCSADSRSKNPSFNDFLHPTNFVKRMTNMISLMLSCQVFSPHFVLCYFSLTDYPKFVLKRLFGSL